MIEHRVGTVRGRALALVLDPADRETLANAALGTALVVCRRVDELVRRGAEPEVSVVVAEPYDVDGIGVGDTLNTIADTAAAPEIVLLFRLTDHASLQVMAVSESGADVRFALRGRSDITDTIAAARRDAFGQRPQRALVRRTLPFIAHPLRSSFIGWALLAGDRVLVSEVARLAGVSIRTLEHRLSAVGYPPARTVAAWYRVLYVAWLLDVEGWSLKQLVGAGDDGLRARRALGNLVKRHTGRTVASLGSPGSFTVLLRQFLDQLGVAGSETTAFAARSTA